MSGSPQTEFSLGDGTVRVNLRQLDDVDGGAVTGGGTAVTGNTIGLLADGVTRSENRADIGVAVWAGASSVQVEGNTIANLATGTRTGTGADVGKGVSIEGGSGHRVVANKIGTDRSGTVDLRVGFGVVLEDTANAAVGVIANGNTILASEGVLLRGSNAATTVDSNFIGLGDYSASNGVATTASGSVEPTATGLSIRRNTIQAFNAGVRLSGTVAAPVIADNVITDKIAAATSGATGIELGKDVVGAKVERNTVFRTNVGVRSEAKGSTFTDNVIGIGTTSEVVGTTAGIWLEADSTADSNTVAGSRQNAIIVSDPAIVKMTANSIYQSGLTPIVSRTGPEAPLVNAAIRTSRSGTDRTMLIVAGLPTDETGTVEVFANDSCDDGEARHVLGITAEKKAGNNYVIVPVVGLASRDNFTATYTNATKGTSQLSNCESRRTYPDSDGDGSPDPLEALAGTDTNPAAAVVITDNAEIIRLDTDEGRFTGVGIVDDPAPGEHPGGFTLPHGVVDFQITGLEDGATATVRLASIDGETPIRGDAYWKYGATPDVAGSSWYRFDMDETTGTGATPTTATLSDGTTTSAWLLTLTDGARGDDDGVVNGTITDPGGPVILGSPDPTTTTTTTTVPPTTPTDPTTPTTNPTGPAPTTPTGPGNTAVVAGSSTSSGTSGASASGSSPTTSSNLALTGNGILPATLLALVALTLGTLAVLYERRRFRRSTNPHNGA